MIVQAIAIGLMFMVSVGATIVINAKQTRGSRMWFWLVTFIPVVIIGLFFGTVQTMLKWSGLRKLELAIVRLQAAFIIWYQKQIPKERELR